MSILIEKEFIVTIRTDMGDHYEDTTKRMFGESKEAILSELEGIYGKNTDLIFIVTPL